MLQHFRLAQYRFILTALDPIVMPSYAGSTLRGGFGQAFQKLVCVVHKGKNDGQDRECKDCSMHSVCPFAYIFKTDPGDNALQLRTYSDVPRPFVLDPLETKGNYRPGQEFEFLLTLIGQAIDFFPYFILSFRQLGEMGIGKGRGRFGLTRVLAQARSTAEVESIYSVEEDMVKNLDHSIGFQDIEGEATSLPSDAITLEFLTPTRILDDGHLRDELPFQAFVKRLLGRISALSYFHCHEPLEMDFKSVIEDARRVKIVKSGLSWYDWERYSSRQDNHMLLGGILGKITYQGNLKPFLPYIALGQYTHVGKNCTFGLGKYRVGE